MIATCLAEGQPSRKLLGIETYQPGDNRCGGDFLSNVGR